MGGGLGDVFKKTTGIGFLIDQTFGRQERAQAEALAAQQRAAMEARRIAAEAKPMEEAATLQTDTGGSVLGNLGLSVEADYSKKKTSALGGTSSPVGLGFGS